MLRTFRPLIAVVLALLWLPATLHCALEAAEVLAEHCAGETDAGCSSAADDCNTDTCWTVEELGYRDDLRTPAFVPLPWVDCADLTCAVTPSHLTAATDSLAPPDRGSRRQPWLPAWAFERRAAALAQAPNPSTV